MPKLSALFNPEETAEFTLSYGDEEVRITYAPAEVNPDRLDEMSALAEDNPDMTQGEAWSIILSPVRDWDVLDEEGNKLSISAGVLAQLPTSFLQAIQRGMVEAVRPTLKSKRSRRGSRSLRS